jgi:hypothetical protein
MFFELFDAGYQSFRNSFPEKTPTAFEIWNYAPNPRPKVENQTINNLCTKWRKARGFTGKPSG